MKYEIVLHCSGEGCSVRVQGLPGCRSQGETEPGASFATVRLRRSQPDRGEGRLDGVRHIKESSPCFVIFV